MSNAHLAAGFELEVARATLTIGKSALECSVVDSRLVPLTRTPVVEGEDTREVHVDGSAGGEGGDPLRSVDNSVVDNFALQMRCVLQKETEMTSAARGWHTQSPRGRHQWRISPTSRTCRRRRHTPVVRHP